MSPLRRSVCARLTNRLDPEEDRIRILILAAVASMLVMSLALPACSAPSYFDWVMYVARTRLAAATGVRRATLARDAYAYLQWAMVAGIVLFAYGVETALHDTAQPLEAVPSTALAGGVASTSSLTSRSVSGQAAASAAADRSLRPTPQD